MYKVTWNQTSIKFSMVTTPACGMQGHQRLPLPRELPSGMVLQHSSSFMVELTTRDVLEATPTRAEWPTDAASGKVRALGSP